MLVPRVLEVARSGDQTAAVPKEVGVSNEELLEAIEEEREEYYPEKYAQS